MHKLSEWFTRNPVAANLMMLLILVGGFFTVKTIRIEGFPAMPPNSITITTVYPGANAEQVDRSVTRKVETALKGMNGIKKMRSQSNTGISTVWIQKTSNMDLDRFQNEIKSRVDAIWNMPRYAEKSIIEREEFTISALLLQVYSDLDELTMQKSSKLVKERLLDHPKISKLNMFGAKNEEIRIELNEERIRSLGLSVFNIAQSINRSSLDYKLGELKSENGTILIRADKKAFEYEEFLNIPIYTPNYGARILLKDVAKIIDGFEEVEGFSRYQGKPTIGFEIFTTQKGHLNEVSEAVREVIEKVKPELPKGIQMDIWGETSVYMNERLNLLATNAWQGLLIVFFLLAIFLNIRLAFWVAMGIPISIAGTMVIMGERFLNYSLNEITTFGLILVLGILVDDAVVVGESIFNERKKIKDPIKGTIKGVHRVATATIFGAFTTIAAFYPLSLINNELGKLFGSFAMIVVVAILFSLVESKFILPAHLAEIKNLNRRSKYKLGRWWRKVQESASKGLDYVINNVYSPILLLSLKHKLSSLVAFLSIAIIGISLIFNGQVRTVFFPQIPGQIVTVTLKMDNGSPLRLTVDNMKKIEDTAIDINKEIIQRNNLEKLPISKVFASIVNSTEGIIFAELEKKKVSGIGTNEIIKLWREKVGPLEGVDKLTYSGTFETGGGFTIELTNSDAEMLKESTAAMKNMLRTINGIYDVSDNFTDGSPQFRLHLKPEAEHLNMSVEQLASQIGNAFGGLEIQRLQRGLDDVKVLVKYEGSQRQHIEDLLNSRIQNEIGEWIPLQSIADIKLETAETALIRNNGLLTTEINANIDKGLIGASQAFELANNFYKNKLRDKYPGLVLRAGGELSEITELRGGVRGTFVIIFLLIFTLLAIPLKSYWKPFVIMSVIPFGFVGATFGHLITGHPLSLLSFFGMLAVMGIVVNDSLVLITRFNQFLEEGIPVNEAILKAGTSRFRAIFLTTVTTVAGLTPLMLETSEQAQYLIPAAISLAFGEIFATVITLLVIPLLLASVYSLKRKKEQKKIIYQNP